MNVVNLAWQQGLAKSDLGELIRLNVVFNNDFHPMSTTDAKVRNDKTTYTCIDYIHQIL